VFSITIVDFYQSS